MATSPDPDAEQGAIATLAKPEPWHHTYTGYAHYGCREECCKAARRAYDRDRAARVYEFGSTCWCEETVVPVTPEMTKAGETGSCGRPRCQP